MIIICSICGQEYESNNPFEEEELCSECAFELLNDSDSMFSDDVINDEYDN
jgi:rubredoxin